MLKLAAATLLGATGALALSTPLDSEFEPRETPRGFSIHTTTSAPESVRSIFGAYQENFGFVPNLGAVMAGSPSLMDSYWHLQSNLREHGLLSQEEINVVQMSIAVENECTYCTAGHTMAGRMFFETPEDVMDSLRAGQRLADPKLQALQSFSLALYESRGRVTDTQLEAFLAAGYSREQALDVVACVGAKVLSNYTNQLAGTPLDEPLLPLAEGLSFGS